MRMSLSPRDLGAQWRRRWPLLLLVVAIPIIAYLIFRPKGQDEPPARGSQAVASKTPRYENRGLWRASGQPRQRAAPVAGTVYDETGRPIEGVVVSATTFQIAGNQAHVAGRAKTDVRGRFELPLADGSYYLNADKDGYGSTLALAHSGDDIGIVLLTSGSISGTVKDERGRPVTRFTIDVIGPSTDDMAAPAPFISKRIESADGSFRITQLPDRPMYLRAVAEGYAPSFSDPLKVAKDGAHEVHMVMTKGCVLTGVVEDAEGRPVSEVLVDAELRKSAGVIGDTSIDAASKDETDAEGQFRLENVTPGNVLVRAYDGTHAPAALPVQIEKCEDVQPIHIRMSAGGQLTGMVKDADGKAVPGIKLVLMNRAIGFVNTFSDAEGRYRFEKLPTGSMRVEAHRGLERAAGQLHVDDGKTTEMDLVFSPAGQGEISGRVAAGDTPVQGMQLLVARAAGGGLINMHYPVTGPDGTYRVTGLPDGVYGVLVSSLNLVSSAYLKEGSRETVSFDVSKRQEPAKPPPDFDIEEARRMRAERMNQTPMQEEEPQ